MSTSHTNKIYFDDMIEVKNEKFYKTFDSFLKFYKQFRQNEILDLNQREKNIIWKLLIVVIKEYFKCLL